MLLDKVWELEIVFVKQSVPNHKHVYLDDADAIL